MDIMDSPPRSQPLDPVLPPMPRRQSCDRCHEQKVRCVTEGPNGALTLGGIAEEGESNPDGHVVAPVPCGRCRKAGTVCIYSPQLRSGRPRRRRDSNIAPPRKRTRRASRCSSSSSSSQTSFQPSPPSSSHALSHPFGGMGFNNSEHSQESTHEFVPSRTVSSPVVTTPICEQITHHSLGLDTPPPTEDWQTPSYHCDSTQSLADMCPVTSFPAGPSVAYAPVFQDPAANLVPAAENIVGGYSWCLPASSDYFLEELGQINVRIHLAGRALPSPVGAPAPWSWPATNNGFDAACSLIDAVDRFAARRQAAPFSEPPNAHTDGRTIDAALDSSACLMVHACHQALLGIFEHLSAALLLYLAEQQQQQTPPRTPPDATFLPPYQTQAVIMTNLISHLLNQLDRAFLSLSATSNHAHSQQHPQQQQQNHKAGVLRSMAGFDQGPPPGPSGGAADALFSEMAQRQSKVRGQVKAVERLLRPLQQQHVA
ncbi:uncharacterized protein B0H64DRAFT_386075 [Chaetomium fimeti]|uniref:Zn(2)-C6 fungal-type domain-containing protein n=1 Tax=Chaetomium fimeti TaxID=1854472 RepID=A0AAE0HLI0_9PEZI|nr:hypothetical protein B0H64DRAFT_386075 [Chaetomium fimeti]